jgi:2'-5' RNA ligase
VRLFVAAYPPEDACADLAAMVDGLAVGRAAAEGVNARLAPRANWHVTLAFLGDVPDERLDDARAALVAGTARWRTSSGRAVPSVRGAPRAPVPSAMAPSDGVRPRLRLAGGGRFGRGRFTVLWVGLRGEVEVLTSLATAVRKELKRARLPYDPKPLRPHLTLARPGDRVDVRDDVAVLDAYEGPQWSLEEVRLMRSHPGPKPTYDRLAEVPLT